MRLSARPSRPSTSRRPSASCRWDGASRDPSTSRWPRSLPTRSGRAGRLEAICDAQWLPFERQVGSSGQTVAPKLYLALGISGAIQHVVG